MFIWKKSDVIFKTPTITKDKFTNKIKIACNTNEYESYLMSYDSTHIQS